MPHLHADRVVGEPMGHDTAACIGLGAALIARSDLNAIMIVTPAMAEAVENGLPATKLRQIATSEGMVELAAAGMEQVLAGRTTVEEVFYKLSG